AHVRGLVVDRVVPATRATVSHGAAGDVEVRVERGGTAHGIKRAHVVVARRVLTAKTDEAETAFQTDPRLTRATDAVAGISVDAVLEGELGLQAVAQILGTTEADARSRQQAGLDTVELVVTGLEAGDT